MKLWLELDGATQPIELAREGARAHLVGEGRDVDADVAWLGDSFVSIILGGRSYDFVAETDGPRVTIQGSGSRLTAGLSRRPPSRRGRHAGPEDGETIGSPMPGKVVAVLVTEGERVSPGQAIVIVEAMKMENELRARAAGIVGAVHVKPGQIVSGGAPLVEIQPCSS